MFGQPGIFRQFFNIPFLRFVVISANEVLDRSGPRHSKIEIVRDVDETAVWSGFLGCIPKRPQNRLMDMALGLVDDYRAVFWGDKTLSEKIENGPLAITHL